jgi:cytoskeletal protein RodZ
MMRTLLPYRWTRLRYLAALPVLLAVVLAFSAIGFAQVAPSSSSPAAQSADQTSSDTGSSLGAAARKAKAQNPTHAKKVFTDEDMELQAGPLPRLKMDGAENADDVTAAIAKYKLTHTAGD